VPGGVNKRTQAGVSQRTQCGLLAMGQPAYPAGGVSQRTGYKTYLPRRCPRILGRRKSKGEAVALDRVPEPAASDAPGMVSGAAP
jgi:hypothetical protein